MSSYNCLQFKLDCKYFVEFFPPRGDHDLIKMIIVFKSKKGYRESKRLRRYFYLALNAPDNFLGRELGMKRGINKG